MRERHRDVELRGGQEGGGVRFGKGVRSAAVNGLPLISPMPRLTAGRLLRGPGRGRFPGGIGASGLTREQGKLAEGGAGLGCGGQPIPFLQREEIATQGVKLRVKIVASEIMDFRFPARGRAGKLRFRLPACDPFGVPGAGPMGPPVAGKGRVGVQEHLRPLFPEMAEKDVLGARQRPEAGQQDRAPGQKARKRLVFPHDAFFPQGACDHEGVEARGGETGLKEGFPVAGENGAERTEQRRPEGGHFAFGVEHVVWRKPVREAFLQQIGQPHTPREKARLVGFGELDAEVRARMSQFPHAMGEEGDLIELAGLAPGPGVACLPEGGHELALREHAWDEAGAGDVRGVAQALAQVTARTVVHEDDHGVAGMASGGVHEALFEGVQKIGVPRDDAERRAGDHGCVGRNLCQRIVRLGADPEAAGRERFRMLRRFGDDDGELFVGRRGPGERQTYSPPFSAFLRDPPWTGERSGESRTPAYRASCSRIRRYSSRPIHASVAA